jgi:hypothetical protein
LPALPVGLLVNLLQILSFQLFPRPGNQCGKYATQPADLL